MLFSALFFTSACNKLDDIDWPVSKSQKVLSLKIDASYGTSQTDDWLLLHDVNGKLIAYKTFESGDLINIETTKPIPEKKVNVTYFQFSPTHGYSSYTVKSYLNNDLGQEWTLKTEVQPTVPYGNVIGNFKANIRDVPPGVAYQFSNKKQILFGDGTWNESSRTFALTMQLFENNRDCLFYMTNNLGEPRYQFLRNINANDVFNVSFASMNKFDKVVKLTFPPVQKDRIYYWVNNSDTNNADRSSGFLLNCNLSNTYYGDNNPVTELALGYLDSFSVYNTVLEIAYDSVRYSYTKFGSRPEAIHLPLTSKFTLTNRTISDFDFTYNQAYASRNSNWRYLDTSQRIFIGWDIVCPFGGKQKFKELPPEFASKYQTFSLDKPKHSFSSFITEGTSYDENILNTFEGKTPNKFSEFYIVSVR